MGPSIDRLSIEVWAVIAIDSEAARVVSRGRHQLPSLQGNCSTV